MFFEALAPLQARVGRAEIMQALTCAGYLLISAILLWAGAKLPGLIVTVVGAAIAWHLSNRRWHLINDTPTTRVRSAAQGFVELSGTAELSPGQLPLAFNGLPACVWYEVVITDVSVSSGGHSASWVRVSDETFVLRDDTGECVIDPDHAEVHRAHTRRWRMEDRRYSARYLLQGDALYAIGALETLRGGDGGLDRRADVAHLLRQWKRDPSDLKRRFDSDGDGDITPQEWQQAVVEAERIVDSQHKELRAHPDTHVMRAPKTGLPYILSNQDPDTLALRFRYWSWFHLTAFLVALGACGWYTVN